MYVMLSKTHTPTSTHYTPFNTLNHLNHEMSLPAPPYPFLPLPHPLPSNTPCSTISAMYAAAVVDPDERCAEYSYTNEWYDQISNLSSSSFLFHSYQPFDRI